MSDIIQTADGQAKGPDEETVYQMLARLGIDLEVTVDRADILVNDRAANYIDPLRALVASADQVGILLKELKVDEEEAVAFVREGYPLILSPPDGSLILVDAVNLRMLEASCFGANPWHRMIRRHELRDMISNDPQTRIFIAKKQFDCDSLSDSPYHDSDHRHLNHHHHEGMSPVRRFIGLLRMESSDIWTVVLFAFVSGVLTLATPLAVESLVNVVSWGVYLQPLVVLGLILLTCLGIAGVLKVLQTLVVELIQRRQFVRIVSDLAHRFPRANQESLTGQYPRELANRVFDIMTIQKATAILLLDGISIVLTTMIGLVLLAFYHPFLLGFDIVLVIAMISITWVLGRGGIRTAIDESLTKYRVAQWLQDVLSTPAVFKSGGGEALAIARGNQLTAQYVTARKRQFRVVIRQVAFAISLQAVASTALLALGGWLVIDGQLTLGQLVASELVVTVVVGAFAKAGKTLEKFYDLMAGVDKVGHLIDIPADPRQVLDPLPEGPIEVAWSDMRFQRAASQSHVAAAVVTAGSRVAVRGDDDDGCSDLARTIAGLQEPTEGHATVGEFDAKWVALEGSGRVIGYAGDTNTFVGTLRENIDLGRTRVGRRRVREVLNEVGLADAVLKLDDGVETRMQTGGFPLSKSQLIQLVIARAIAGEPKLLVIDRLLDLLSQPARDRIWKVIAADDAPWTLVVVTNREDLAVACDSQISVRLS